MFFRLLMGGCLLLVATQLAAQEPPTIQVRSGPQELCIDAPFYEICVTISVDPEFTEPINRFEITWGDGSPMTIVPGSANPPNQTHTYDLSDFFNTCSYSTDDFGVRLNTVLEDSTRLNNAFFPTFKNKPIAIIGNDQSVACLGEEVCFGNNSCPTTNLEVVL